MSGILGSFEQLVLLAVLRHSDAAYANTVREELEAARGGRPVSRGALYRTLDRMEAKAYVESVFEGAVIPERGGHPMRRFQLTERGLAELRASRATLLHLWEGLEQVLSDQ
jgi:DNA-binding PadR family transcriptional regulator